MSRTILISLIGNEPTGNFRAYKEFAPNILIHVFSSETHETSRRILSLVDKVKTHVIEIEIEGDDYLNTLEKLKCIPFNFQQEDCININVTGGTKMMSLAAVDFGKSLEQKSIVSYMYTDIKKQQVNWFYENKNETFCDDLELEEYIALAGQKLKSKELFVDLESKFSIALSKLKHVLKNHLKRKMFQDLLTYFIKEVSIRSEQPNYKQKRIKSYFLECIPRIQNKGYKIEWDDNILCIYFKDDLFLEFELSDNDLEWFLFYAGWFELLTAEKLAKKYPDDKIYMNVKFPLLEKIELDKNEVDILILQNGKIIFVECKSGVVTSKDINNMKVRQETYGGIGAKNILVTRFDLFEGKLDSNKLVVEKCKDLKIEIIHFNKL
jgi:hypothetical protein